MRSAYVLFFFFAFSMLVPAGQAAAQSKSPQSSHLNSSRIERATANANRKLTYKLEYRFKRGDQIRWSVEHVASTRTQMAGETEETSSRSESIKLWEVQSVDSQGKTTFDHSIESVNMWQKIGEQSPVKYNSKTDQKPPLEYESLAERIGTVLATISINPAGQIVDRKSPTENKANFGVGDITIPLPEKAVPVGYKWSVPSTLRATDEDGVKKQLKSRVIYELTKVKSNNAYIAFKTEVLTPVESEKVRSQIMQQMTRGYLVFDMTRGYPIRKEVEWDEKVQGFEGADSLLEYLARLTERVVDAPSSKVSRKTNGIKPIK